MAHHHARFKFVRNEGKAGRAFDKKDRSVYIAAVTTETLKINKAERTRKRIIEAAAAVINQKGYHATSINDIMEVADISKGGIYGNFKNKEEIAIAAFDYAVRYITESVAERLEKGMRAQEKLMVVVSFYLDHTLNPPIEGGCPILNTAVEMADAHSTLRDRVVNALMFWRSSIIHVVEKGIERGEVNSSVDPIAFGTCFIAMLEGGIMATRLTRDESIIHMVMERLREMIESDLKPHE